MVEGENPVVPYTAEEVTTAVTSFTDELYGYLGTLGLPNTDVLVAVPERRRVINNLPEVAVQVPATQRAESMYLSKYTAACAAGLFDAALNYLWDETVSNLRGKVARFDLEYFYDTAVPDPSRRKEFRSDEDLPKLADYDLIRGCQATGIISEIGYRHLDFIRDMRNHVSAAHPNQNEISGLQLVAWLETCVREVLSKEPEGPVVEVRRLLRNLRTQTLSATDMPPIMTAVAQLPEQLAEPLLRSMFGLYTDPNTAAVVRTNIQLTAGAVWTVAGASARAEIGVKCATFAVNGEVDRSQLGRQFLEVVDGLTVLPEEARAVEIDSALTELLAAHTGFNNFYNEPPRARILARLVPDTGAVPAAVERRYVKILTLCRLGNGYGVSWDAQPTYDILIARLTERQMALFVRSLGYNREVSSRLQMSKCQSGCQIVARAMRARAANVLLQRALEVVLASSNQNLQALKTNPRYADAVRDLAPLLGD